MKILNEGLATEESIRNARADFVRNLGILDRIYSAYNAAIKELQNIEFSATMYVDLPEIKLYENNFQDDVLAGIVSEPATEEEIEYLTQLNAKLKNIISNAK